MTPIETGRALSEYDFDLPRELVAQHPKPNREDARLMIVDRGQDSVSHAHFRDLPSVLEPGDCLVINETRVIPAKLVGYRTTTGGRWHGLFIEHDSQTDVIKLLCKTRGRIQEGELVTLQDREGVDRHQLRLLARLEHGHWAARLEPALTMDEMFSQLGRIPLPHYIRDGNMTDADIVDYQTIYARAPGSIAAPTAGLHFTERLLGQLIDRGVRVCRVVLHVGLGTFRPISTETIEQHEMHAERGTMTDRAVQAISDARARGNRVVAVGTTTVRLLETVGQLPGLEPWSGESRLFIGPGHSFRIVDAMITNFHLPRTTLLVLARSFGGDELIRRAYREAVEQEYRFFSYGDAMMIM